LVNGEKLPNIETCKKLAKALDILPEVLIDLGIPPAESSNGDKVEAGHPSATLVDATPVIIPLVNDLPAEPTPTIPVEPPAIDAIPPDATPIGTAPANGTPIEEAPAKEDFATQHARLFEENFTPTQKEDYLEKLARRLQLLCSARGMEIPADLCKRAKMAKLKEIWNGLRYPTIQESQKMAKCLKISIEDLLIVTSPLPRVDLSFYKKSFYKEDDD